MRSLEESVLPTDPGDGGEAGCGDCSVCGPSDCPVADPSAGELLVGWRLAAASLGFFVLPVLLAIAGGLWAGESRPGQLAGALAGLSLGAAGCWLVSRAFFGRQRE